MRRFYLTTRDLHLYIGLFLSPFVDRFLKVFAVMICDFTGPGAHLGLHGRD